ncbi:MAG: hypothetical protein ABIH08_01220 [Candidatus Omnitrophota bacterium]
MLTNQEKVKIKVEEIVEAEGAELIDFKVFFSRTKNIARCIVDYSQGGITVIVCAKINKSIFAYLDESRLLGDDFTVEVNSPGLDRPLKSSKDFLRAQGRTILLWLSEPVNDKTYFEGEVLGVNEDILSLLNKKEVLKIDFGKIKVGKEKIGIL